MTRPPPSSTLFPYTTLFRSAIDEGDHVLSLGWADRRCARHHGCHAEPAAASAKLGDIHGCVHPRGAFAKGARSEEHTSELQSHVNLVCRLLLEKKNMQVQSG